MPFTIRAYTDSDALPSLELYLDTIRRINQRDYSPTQIAAWASSEITVEDWHSRFDGRYAIIAEEGRTLVGFSDLTADGYLDRLFVSSRHQRRGIARALMLDILTRAKQMGIEQIHADVSITAKPFFLASGFDVVREQTVQSRGIKFVNFRMAARPS